MHATIQKLSEKLDINACVHTPDVKNFLHKLFTKIAYANNTKEINHILENRHTDLLILEINDSEIIKNIKNKYPKLEIVLILSSQTIEELKNFLKLNISAIDIKDITSAQEVLFYNIKKINDKRNTHLKITSLEDKVYEFTKLLNVYGENVIASVTDTKGIIKYATQAFCNIGNYKKEDLLGKPHNIIRHPDMPKEIFKDMWDTLKRGEIWKGEVKNRKKDGGFYWVYATISPEYNIQGEIIGYSAIRQDITDKKYVEEMAITDSLTSLYNRYKFDAIINLQLKHIKRNNLQLNFLLLDIDYFKQYNDTYGHAQGDYTLKEVALSMKKRFQRPDDYCFRLGGEEFGVLFYSNTKEDAFNVCNLLRQDVENLQIPHENSKVSKYLTFSAGLYTIDNQNDTQDNLYKCCDELLYTAKENGRNRITS